MTARWRVLRRHRRRRDRGAVAVLTALLLLPLMLVTALVVDIGNARDLRRQWQNAADAGALAAANALFPAAPATTCTNGSASPCFGDANRAAMTFVQLNSSVTAASWAGCSAGASGAPSSLGYVVSGSSSCISYDSATAPTTVRVSMPTLTAVTFFGGITGVSSFAVGASADAKVGTSLVCTICFLGSVVGQNADFTASGGAIAVDGNINVGPNSVWTATLNQVVGTVTGGQFTPASTPIPSFNDPLASLALPPNWSGLTAKSNPCTDGPGVYAAAITLSAPNGSSSCTLQPGLYVVQNTWSLKNNTSLTGTGVTLYAQAGGGFLDFKNGYVGISAPTDPANPLNGLAIVYDRANSNSLSLQGNGSTNTTGGIYIPNGNLSFNGNSCFTIDGGPVVALGVGQANGNKACLSVTHAHDQTVAHQQTFLSR